MMRNHSKNQVALQLLVYTRAANFDYQWVLGLEDKSVEKALENYLLDWLGTSLLAKLPSVTTFFKFRQYNVLMLAEGSETRNDLQGRRIFQRAIFMWEAFNGLLYKHLEPLAVRLSEESENIYKELPDNVFNYPTGAQKYTVSLQELEDEAEIINIDKCRWELPQRLTWSDVSAYKLTVEVPNTWSFDKMIAGIADQSVNQSNAIYIGNALHFENRVPPDHGWIVSADTEDGPEGLVRVLRSTGQPLQVRELASEQRESAARVQGRQENSGAKGASKTARASVGNAESGKAAPGTEDPITTSKDKELKESAEYDQEALKNLFDVFADAKGAQGKSEKWEFIRSIKRLLERNHLPIVQAETRLLRLLAPATQVLGNDVRASRERRGHPRRRRPHNRRLFRVFDAEVELVGDCRTLLLSRQLSQRAHA